MTLSRYHRRFGGAGTIITLDDGRAFTAAHCVAAVDGRAGIRLFAADGGEWAVVRRWSPRRYDLALLRALNAPGLSSTGRRVHKVRPAKCSLLRPGVDVLFFGFDGERFVQRRAVVANATGATAVAEVEHRAGVASGDSGGPVLLGGALVGVVTHRTGEAVSSSASTQVVFVRVDSAWPRIAMEFVRPLRSPLSR